MWEKSCRRPTDFQFLAKTGSWFFTIRTATELSDYSIVLLWNAEPLIFCSAKMWLHPRAWKEVRQRVSRMLTTTDWFKRSFHDFQLHQTSTIELILYNGESRSAGLSSTDYEISGCDFQQRNEFSAMQSKTWRTRMSHFTQNIVLTWCRN